jgi:hypothetical protein
MSVPKLNVIVGVCREDSQFDVDEAYGPGTYARLFPKDECPHCGEEYFRGDLHMCADTQEDPR